MRQVARPFCSYSGAARGNSHVRVRCGASTVADPVPVVSCCRRRLQGIATRALIFGGGGGGYPSAKARCAATSRATMAAISSRTMRLLKETSSGLLAFLQHEGDSYIDLVGADAVILDFYVHVLDPGTLDVTKSVGDAADGLVNRILQTLV
jgi:hypothetical protein